MVPVLEAAKQVHDSLRDSCPGLDEVIPLTHQDMAEDVEMAKMGLFPVIIGGHDHELINEVHGPWGTPVVKAGSDSTSAAVVDLDWPEDPKGKPRVTVALKEVSNYPPDEEFAKLVRRILRPVRELESATLYVLQRGEALSSVGVNVAPSTMATCLATAVRDVLQADAAVLNSGAVRGSKVYSHSVSFGDLKSECPYPTPMIIVPMPFAILREAVGQSRAAWPAKTPSSLQVDSGIHVGGDGYPTTVGGSEPRPDRLYTVACDVRVLGRNGVFSEYCRRHPARIPPADAGRPLLPILVEFFCGLMWASLLEKATTANLRSTVSIQANQPEVDLTQLRQKSIDKFVHMLDKNDDGRISLEEIRECAEEYLGEEMSSGVILQQMLSMLDKDGDGILTTNELRSGLIGVLNGH
ncbi:unnamed protein product [Prorocentrum cordatum]|uniref:EF-hand domain-containing protein n=1 Tax=Prorocentrum cordatum TaxID=2364126 RepID=A0ABN9VVV9_9DINO|nr:unnamed protein product [Polarella glacialis]